MFFEKYILTCWRFANVDKFTMLHRFGQGNISSFLQKSFP